MHPASDCLLKSSVAALDGLPPGLVLAPIDLAPTRFFIRIIRSSPAASIARSQESSPASTPSRDRKPTSERVVRQHAPDYLVLCPDWAETETAEPPPFAKQLAEGAEAAWLERVPLTQAR